VAPVIRIFMGILFVVTRSAGCASVQASVPGE